MTREKRKKDMTLEERGRQAHGVDAREMETSTTADTIPFKIYA